MVKKSITIGEAINAKEWVVFPSGNCKTIAEVGPQTWVLCNA